MELYEAIFKRKSTRQYSMEPLPEDVFAHIESIGSKAERLYDTGLQIHVVRDGKKIHDTFKGILSSYVKVTAPHYLVVSSEEKPGWKENSGYTLEQVVLEMTQMGLATCWMGGPADRESLKESWPSTGPASSASSLHSESLRPRATSALGTRKRQSARCSPG